MGGEIKVLVYYYPKDFLATALLTKITTKKNKTHRFEIV